jgi:guanylate kinase
MNHKPTSPPSTSPDSPAAVSEEQLLNQGLHNPCVFIISAPSGSGKSTLVDRLMKELSGLRFSVSYTTRKPRGIEQNGREYYFVSRSEFEAMIGHDDLLEWAEVFGNYYGTARRFLDEARERGEDLLLDIDVQGAAQVRQRISDAVSVFILPPSRAEMETRLRKRGQDTEDVISKRLRDAQREIKNVDQYDYVLINEHLERSAECLRAIVENERNRKRGSGATAEAQRLREVAEACRTLAQRDRVAPILAGFQELDGRSR